MRSAVVVVGALCAGAVTALGAGPGLAETSAPALSTDAIIAKHIAARGGLEALHAIKTLKMTGVMRPGGFDAHLAYEEIISRPDSVRIDATLQGLTVVQAYDGAGGWQIQPFQGRKDPETLSSDDVKSLQEEADFEGPLIDAKEKGAVITNLGTDEIDGAPAYALRVTLKNGDQQTYYLDPDAWLTIRIVTRQILRGAETLTQTDLGDYENVDGVYFPFEVATGPKGSTNPERVTYDKIVANEPVTSDTFERPKPKTAAPAPVAH